MFKVLEDSGATELDVRANDRPGDGGQAPLVVEVTQPVRQYGYQAWNGLEQVGMVEIASDGHSVIFTSTENFFGTATFTYTVFDEVRGRETATVTVEVENVPDDPDAVDDEFAVEPGAQGVTLNVLANDVNVDVQTDGFNYYNSGLVFRTIDTNDLVAFDAAPLLTPNTLLVDSVSSLITQVYGFVDPFYWRVSSPGGLTISSVGAADQGGTVEIDGGGVSLKYTPADGFEGVETFAYTIETSAGRTDTATVAVRVGQVSEAAWATVLEGLNRQSASESVEVLSINVSATSAARFSAIDTSHRSFAETTDSAHSFRHSLMEPQIVAHAAANLFNLSLATADGDREVQSSTDDAFEELLTEPGGKAGFCDELAETLVAELAAGLIELQ
jgi:hypothetical protein